MFLAELVNDLIYLPLISFEELDLVRFLVHLYVNNHKGLSFFFSPLDYLSDFRILFLVPSCQTLIFLFPDFPTFIHPRQILLDILNPAHLFAPFRCLTRFHFWWTGCFYFLLISGLVSICFLLFVSRFCIFIEFTWFFHSVSAIYFLLLFVYFRAKRAFFL